VTRFEAPRGAIDRRRRPLRPGHVLVTIEDVLIITWPVRAESLRSVVPRPLEPVRQDRDGLVSAVLFRNRALRPAIIGLPRLSSFQMNVRIYVLDPETNSPTHVFFHGLYVSRRWLARISSALFGIPFQHLPFSIAVRRDADRIAEWQAHSADARLAVVARESTERLDATILDLLTNPHTAWFADSRSVLKRWSIWHRPQCVHTLDLESCAVPQVAEFDAGPPMTALFVPSVDYEVYLPPGAA